MSKKQKQPLICPCCKSEVYKAGMTQTLGQSIRIWGVVSQLQYGELRNGRYQWACDACLNSGKAIHGDSTKQVYLDYYPNLAYFDQTKTCNSCGTEFVFSKDEQKYWYEQLQFWVQSTPINCVDCRKEIRYEKQLNTELSALLEDKDALTIADLERVASIYAEMNKPEQSKFYLNLLAKAKKKLEKNMS